MNALDTIPETFTMATTERFLLGFDTSKLLTSGQVPSTPTSVLIDRSAQDAVITLAVLPVINGDLIQQQVEGSSFVAKHDYRLSITFVASDTTTWTMVLDIKVPQ